MLHRKPSVETSTTTAPATGRRGEVIAVAAVVISESKAGNESKELYID